METTVIIVLVLVGILFFVIEVFLIPGISIAGIASGLCFLAAIFYAFTVSATAGLITLGISALGIIFCIYWLMKSKTVDKYSLKKTLDFKDDKVKKYDIKIGDKGVAITRLALIGNADINGNIVEVRSAEGFVDENTLIYVERISGDTIMVRKRHDK